MINYLTADKSTLIWFCFTVYVVTAVFLLPKAIDLKFDNADASYQQALQFASGFILRTTLIVPMIFLLQINL